ncbi:trophoblast glycoprotein [Cryptotermes secundus]|uniref:trophoblast glycoprotein n=1 Tax=Cryptotermes secundus TaxID=105785 RepID=UPI000CD7CCC8|nr:trophoblast glycoprotein [Cryptotermes secundus]XP_023702517.1 trophoblast glycoprotein [Cryptotermes secundus]XP_023702518.1 trophoblast glycoprotein [Cryptotermes secundus]
MVFVRMRFVTIFPFSHALPMLLGLSVVFGDCGPKFGGKCSCGEGQYQEKNEQYIVNCTNTGFNNISVLQHIPPQTQVLIFSGNNIPELPWNVFGTLNNYSRLRVVDMSNNKIREIRGKSYHRVGNVQRLILNHNDLSISSTDGSSHHHPRVFSSFINLMELHLTDAFADNTPDDLAADLHDIFVNSNLTQLTKLHLEQNEITGFRDPQVFCDLPNLMDLHLGDNLLRGIDFNITCLRHLRFLDLERNRISGFNTGDLDTLDSFPSQNQSLVIDLRGNHFLCDCNIADLYAWLQKTQVQVRNKEMLRCHRGLPESNGGEPIMDLRQIQCAPNRTAIVGSGMQHKATAVVLGVLTVILFALLAAVVYMNRVQIKYRLMPILDTVSRKVQYTTIGKQDEPEMDV